MCALNHDEMMSSYNTVSSVDTFKVRLDVFASMMAGFHISFMDASETLRRQRSNTGLLRGPRRWVRDTGSFAVLKSNVYHRRVIPKAVAKVYSQKTTTFFVLVFSAFQRRYGK
jgi:hypothetical protein